MGMSYSIVTIVVQFLIIFGLLVSLVPCRETTVGTNLMKGALPSPSECTYTGGRLAKSTSSHVHGCPRRHWTSSITAMNSQVGGASAPAPTPTFRSTDSAKDMGKINAAAIASTDLN